jgi:hypothetical protein
MRGVSVNCFGMTFTHVRQTMGFVIMIHSNLLRHRGNILFYAEFTRFFSSDLNPGHVQCNDNEIHCVGEESRDINWTDRLL